MPAQPPLPKMTPLESSHLAAAGHDPVTKTLAISFRDGSVYGYADVPTGTAVALASDKSPGSFFNQKIKGQYKSAKLKGPNPKPKPQHA